MTKSLKLKEDDRNALNAIYQKIAFDPTRNITLADLAFDAGINTTKLTYGFKQLFNITVHDFQVEQRMKKAETLLRLSDKDVQTIASMTGYKTKSSFTIAFKKKHGIAPRQWREKNLLTSTV